MKLCLNRTSPYARLALITAHEAGLAGRLELVWVEPWDDPPALLALNPLAKVPALETDEGAVLIESGCICDHLIAVSGHAALAPRDGRERTGFLRRLGFGRAAIDCAFGAVIQRRFNDSADTPLAARWRRALPRAAAALEPEYAARTPAPDLGDLAVAVAFDYVDFRLPEIDWRSGAAALARAVDALRARPAFQATRPGPG